MLYAPAARHLPRLCPEVYKLRKLLIGLVFLFLPAVATAQTATVLANAPIYVSPVATQSPLRVAAAGTTLQVLDDQGEWARIAYNDPQWGRRIGWVQRSTIRIKDEALQPMDLSIPSAVHRSERSSRCPRRKRRVTHHRDRNSRRF